MEVEVTQQATLQRSESITKVAAALVKFSGEVSRVEKDAVNPHLRNKYATVDAIIDEIRPILSKYGLAVIQIPGGTSEQTTMQTMLLHESGEWIMSPELAMRPVKSDPQGVGSVLTYLRRYSLNAFLSLNTGEDDDGNAASGAHVPNSRSETPNAAPQPRGRNTRPSAQNAQQTPSAPAEKPKDAATDEEKTELGKVLRQHGIKSERQLAEFMNITIHHSDFGGITSSQVQQLIKAAPEWGKVQG